MHILFLTPAFPPVLGGGERYARSLALALAGCGHTITVVTSSAAEEAAFWNGSDRGPLLERDGPLSVVRCPIRPFPGGWQGLVAWRRAMMALSLLPGSYAPLLRRMATRLPRITGMEAAVMASSASTDLIHGFNLSWEHALVAGWSVSRQTGIPYVATPFVHSGQSTGHRGWRRLIPGTPGMTMDHQRQLLEEAAAVLALTEAEAHAFTEWGIDAGQVAVVGAGVEPLPPSLPDPAPLLEKYGLTTPFVLFIGRLSEDKGALDAARAVLKVRRRGQKAVLALVGQPTPAFLAFKERLSTPEQAGLCLLGRLTEAEKHALLGEAAMLVLPSRIDSLGIVLLEAWAHGVPVIGARAGGIAHVITESEDGRLVPYGDVEALAAAIEELLHDEERRRRMGNHGWEKVQRRYRWEQVGDRVLEVYKAVLQRKAARCAGGRR